MSNSPSPRLPNEESAHRGGVTGAPCSQGTDQVVREIHALLRAKGWDSIDKIKPCGPLKRLLGISEEDQYKLPTYAAALIKLNVFPREWSDTNQLFHGRRPSFLVNAAVVGQDQARLNLISALKNKRPATIDDVKADHAVARLLGVANEHQHKAAYLAAALIKLGVFSDKECDWPTGHTLIHNQSGPSHLVNPTVVGSERTTANLKKAAAEYVTNRGWRCLDDVAADKGLSKAFGIPESDCHKVTPLLRALLAYGVFQKEWPSESGHPLFFDNRPSYLVLPEIVGETIALNNVELALPHYLAASGITHIDNIKTNKPLAKLLKVKESQLGQMLPLAAALIKHKQFTPEWPVNTGRALFVGSRPSYLTEAEVVTPERAVINKKLAVKEYVAALGWKTIDDVRSDKALAKLLGVERSHRHQVPSLVKALIAHEIFSADWPAGTSHPLIHTNRASYFCDPTIVTDKADANLTLALSEFVAASRWETLDQITAHKALSIRLGNPRTQAGLIPPLIRALIARVPSLSPLIPELYWPPHKTWYLDEASVTRGHALTNARKILQSRYTHLSHVPLRECTIQQILKLLGVQDKEAREQNAALHLLAWGTTFREWAKPGVPEGFKRTPRHPRTAARDRLVTPRNLQRENRLLTTGIGSFMSLRPTRPELARGHALTQLAGVLLQAMHPDDMIIPQFCLRVEPETPYIGERVDFKVGGTLYEVGTGDIAGLCREIRGHQRYHERDRYHYVIMTLNEDAQQRLPESTTHRTIADQIATVTETTLRTALEKTLTLLCNTENTCGITEILRIRDYLYNLIDSANTLTGTARLEFLQGKLTQLCEASSGERHALLFNPGLRAYSPLEAHFESGGALYRDQITLHSFARERERDVDLLSFYTTGPDEVWVFKDILSRDLAIFLESVTGYKNNDGTISPLLLHVGQMLPEQTVRYLPRERPIFSCTLPDGKIIKFQARDLSATPSTAAQDQEIIVVDSECAVLKRYFDFTPLQLGDTPETGLVTEPPVQDNFRFAVEWILSSGAQG